MNHYDEIDYEEHAAVDAMIAEERAAEIEYETLPDLCPTCGAFGMAFCVDSKGERTRDHVGRSAVWANAIGDDV